MLAPSPRTFPIRPLIIAAVVLLLAIAAFVGRNMLAPQAAPAERPAAQRGPAPVVVQTAPSKSGSISAQLTYAGSVQATQQVNLVPRTSGIVQELPVDVGMTVRRGQTLARLDPGTLPDQLLQARANLDSAQAKLAQILAGGKAEDVAAARAQLEQARARLLGLREGRPEDVRVATAALDATQAKLEQMEEGGRVESVAQAQAALDGAQAKLAFLVKGATQDARQAAYSNVESSRASVAAATAALSNLDNTSVTDLESARASIESSRAAVQTADRALAELPVTYPADLEAARSAFEAASSQFNMARTNWDAVINPPSSTMTDAQSNLNSAQATLQSAQARLVQLQQGMDSSSGCAFTTPTGFSTSPNARGIRGNSASCDMAISAAQASVASAQSSVDAARNRMDQTRVGGSSTQRIQTSASLDQAQAALESARSKLETMTVGGLESRRTQLQASADAARQKLSSDEARLSGLLGGGLASQRSDLENRLVAAQEKLKADEAKLAQVLAGPEPEEIEQAQAGVRDAEQRLALAVSPSTEQEIRAQRAAVEQARQQLEKAMLPASAFDIQQQEETVRQMEAQLAGRINPYTSQDVQVARAAVDQARAQVTAAQNSLDQMVLTAPFDGVIGQKLLAVGAFAAPQTPILTLVGNGAEIHITVEEARVGLVGVGQQVSLTVPAYPNTSFPGYVAFVAPLGDARAHTFDITVYPELQDGRLLPGMYASVQVTAAEKQNATLVPREAVVQQDGSPVVFVVDGGKASARRVQTGVSDDQNVEVTSGVSAGEDVITVGHFGLKDGQAVQVPGRR